MYGNDQFSQQFLNSIKTIDNVPCYVKFNDSKFIVVAIHQHLGLVQNFTQTVSKFVQNSASVIIPDLYCHIQDEQINEEDQFSTLKLVKFPDVYSIIQRCLQYAQSKNKIIILMGFSIGASLGLKLIEYFKQVSLGIFFYGYPIAKNLKPDQINCPVVIFHAENDKIKHLSDKQQIQKVLQFYDNQPHIKIERVSSSHGFMNLEHPNYDERSIKNCKKIFHQYLVQIQKGQIQQKAHKNQKEIPKKQQQRGCDIF